MRWLEEHGYGFPVTSGTVPIVPAACIYDLSISRPGVRPDADAGFAAAADASSAPIPQGNVGAGTGATVGKALGIEGAIKGGLGSACERTASGITVGAVVAVNCWGEVVDPENGRVVAGPRGERPGAYDSTLGIIRKRPTLSPFTRENSTIAIVATDAVLGKEQAHRLAVIAQTGLARVIRPVHTPVDGDIVFALATGRNQAETDVLQLGALAALAIERASLRGVLEAKGLGGVPSAGEWGGQ
jgi:L-aminopeptidase/D-esterase-like protein